MIEPETAAERRIRELRTQRSAVEKQMTMIQWFNSLGALNDECRKIDEEIARLSAAS